MLTLGYLLMLESTALNYYKVTIFPIVISKYLGRRYSESKQILHLPSNFHLGFLAG
jgi:hypothetical protein